jgi:hypothetical protein
MWDLGSADKHQAQRHHDDYLNSLSPARERLRSRFEEETGLDLDGSIESLVGLKRWFVERILTIGAADVSLPAWWDPAMPTADEGGIETNPFTRSQLMLVDELQAYLAEVILNANPDAVWVMNKSNKRRLDSQLSMIKFPDGRLASPMNAAYEVGLRVVLRNEFVPDDLLTDYARQWATPAS